MSDHKKIVTTRYRLKKPGFSPCKIALVSDLHEREGSPVLSLIRKEKPDLILAAGDLLERCTEGESEYTKEIMNGWQGIVNDGSSRYRLLKLVLHAGDLLHVRDRVYDNGLEFLKELSKLAPVYYSMGNHEWYFYPEDLEVFRQHGIVLLDNTDVACDLMEGLRIGGLSTRYDLEWLTEFSQKPGPKILLSHHPEYYLRYIKDTDRDTFDLILSGHVHGGQWRIFGRSVLAPGQGLFPAYARGYYDDKILIGAGLSNTASVPRWGNPRELVIIEMS